MFDLFEGFFDGLGNGLLLGLAVNVAVPLLLGVDDFFQADNLDLKEACVVVGMQQLKKVKQEMYITYLST